MAAEKGKEDLCPKSGSQFAVH